MPVPCTEIESAFHFLPTDESAAGFVNTKTGETFLLSFVADLDELPEDTDESGDCLRLPNPRDLDLGVWLVMRFARKELPDHYDEIDRIFSRKGAYRRFKDFLPNIGRLDAWHAYENAATETALREWCAKNGVELEG